MFHKWFERYLTLMRKTILVSKIGAFFIAVLAISEEAFVIWEISMTEGLPTESIARFVTPPIIFFVVFGLRFVLLQCFPGRWKLHMFSSLMSITTVVLFIWATLPVPTSADNPFSAYEDYTRPTLELALFPLPLLALSRFIITAITAVATGDELDSNSR